MIRPPKGLTPSAASLAKPCKIDSVHPVPEGLSLNTAPHPSWSPPPQPETPPAVVVPYRLPAVSMISPAKGAAPSASGTPAKLYRIVSFLLLMLISNTKPCVNVPPNTDVPKRLPLLKINVAPELSPSCVHGRAHHLSYSLVSVWLGLISNTPPEPFAPPNHVVP